MIQQVCDARPGAGASLQAGREEVLCRIRDAQRHSSYDPAQNCLQSTMAVSAVQHIMQACSEETKVTKPTSALLRLNHDGLLTGLTNPQLQVLSTAISSERYRQLVMHKSLHGNV